MDFLDPDKKRKHQRRLFIGYTLIGIAIFMTSAILALQSYGFDFNRKTGEVIQNGLIFADAAPEPAQIILNGKDVGTTDKRLTVPAGPYKIELKRDGYRTWTRSFNLEGSTIERLVYPFLFPSKITPKDQKTYASAPAFSTQSLDRKWILALQPGSMTEFDVFDAGDPTVSTKTISLPTSVLTPTTLTQGYELVEWASDNRHVLLKHNYGDTFEYIILDRDTPQSSININKLLNVTPTKVTLRDKKFDKLYLYDATTKKLSFVDTKEKNIQPVLSNVLSYKSYAEKVILYAAVDDKDPTKATVTLKDGDKRFVIRNGLSSDTYLLDIAKFDDRFYAAVGVASQGKVYIYKDPANDPSTDPKASPSLFTTLIIKDPKFISFSSNARFIMAQSGKKFALYDAETVRRTYFESPLDIPLSYKALWMDGHRIVLNNNNKVVVIDYDGINQQTLVPIIPGSQAYFDRDYTRMYALAPTTNDPAKTSLSRSNLKITLQN